MDLSAAARAIEDFLRALGHESQGELSQTGQRVARAWAEELLSGYSDDAGEVLREAAVPVAADHTGIVTLRDLAVTTMCPHHLLPAVGRATIAYVPTDQVAGFGAISRALNARARRLAFQEQVGMEVAELLVEHLGAQGALCQLELQHTCMVARGSRQASSRVESVAFAGSFNQPGPDRDLALAVIRKSGVATSRAPGACADSDH